MLFVLAPRLLPGRERLVATMTVVLGVAIVAWNLTGEISAAASTNFIGRQFGASLGPPVLAGSTRHARAARRSTTTRA